MVYSGVRRQRVDAITQQLWQAPGLPFGLRRRDVNSDPDTNAQTLVVDIPPGWEMGESWNESDLEFLVESGDLAVAGRDCGAGHYLFLPSGTPLGRIASTTGARLILWLNEQFVVRTGAPATPRFAIQETTDIYDETNWATVQDAFAGVTDTTSHRDIQVPTRCIRLRKHEESGQDTILFVMPAAYSKSALEVHHSAEELFFLKGWCATDPEHVYEPGDYMCWAPGTIHGVVRAWSSVVLSKHHGKLTSPEVPLGVTSFEGQLA